MWHTKTIEEIQHHFKTNPNGFSEHEAQIIRDKTGKNALPKPKDKGVFHFILHQILNPLIYILIIAAVASIIIGEASDAVFIVLVILLNGTLGTYQEYKAAKNAASLRNFMQVRAIVKRNGNWIEIDAEELVPGDWVKLESGVKVPADIRLAEVNGLEAEESLLTGESLPTTKNLSLLEENTPTGDMSNTVFAGSTILKGRGVGIVVEIGTHTRIGSIASKVTESDAGKAPLVVRMEHFIRQISIAILIMGLGLAFGLRWTGMDWLSIFFFVVALAVSTIPEGLPIALTVALSVASRKMAKRKVIVRKLNAVESLGSCTVIASDKTGTLTVNQQTAKVLILPTGQRLSVSGEGYNGNGELIWINEQTKIEYNNDLDKLIEVAVLANEGHLENVKDEWIFNGDSMDVALLALAEKSKKRQLFDNENSQLLQRIPYESELRYAASFHQREKLIVAGMKGAVETVLNHCNLKSNEKENIILNADNLAQEGYRVLAFARGEMNEIDTLNPGNSLKNLSFVGLVGFIDPLRPEVPAAVDACKKAGIRVLMITGDHPKTAASIAKSLGIYDENQKIVTGSILSEIDWKTTNVYENYLKNNNVFARVAPEQKLQIVDELMKNGEFVAVTGDGVNDAPALKKANIGVAMGSGTDVAKDVGDMIILDDNFTSIVAGVEEGRFAYDNVRKVIYLLISTGLAEIILFVGAIALGLPLPLLAVQLLWLNLVTNGIQDVALAFEGGEKSTMSLPPRKTTESVFNRKMSLQVVVSASFIGSTVLGYWFYLNNYTTMSEIHARNLVLLLMVFMQNIHVFNVRSERESTFKIPFSRNPILIVGVLLAQGIHILSMQLPFMQGVLKTEPITLFEWANVLILAFPLLVFMEIYKIVIRKWGQHI